MEKGFYCNKTMCPTSNNRSKLCEASLSLLTIDKQYCISQSYERCPIYSIETRQHDLTFNHVVEMIIIKHY